MSPDTPARQPDPAPRSALWSTYLRSWTGRAALPLLLLGLAYVLWVNAHLEEIAAGVAIFLFGMYTLEQGFKAFSGGSLEGVLQVATRGTGRSMLFGALVTSLTQSSSLVSIIAISFLSAGLLGLSAGIGIIFGANLGTTTGAWLVAGFGLKVNIAAYAMPMLVFGVIGVFQKSRTLNGLGWILTGLGFLFLGIHFMKEGFSAYAAVFDLSAYGVPGVRGLLLYTALGMAATVILQSSHATLMLTITALAANQISYENALALAIGANVGTTATAMLSALGATDDGKRLAWAHLIFNLLTGIVALTFIQPLLLVVERAGDLLGIPRGDHTLRLALFHTLFNVVGIVLMIPLMGPLVRWLNAHVRARSTGHAVPRYLSAASIGLPDVALSAVTKETRHLFKNAFALIAHGVNLRRRDIVGDLDLQSLLEPRADVIDIDLEQQYELSIKDIYSANIAFLSQAQANAGPEHGAAFQALWRANQGIVAAIKATKHLRDNLNRYSRSPNVHIRREYNRLRIRVGTVLRQLACVQQAEEGPLGGLALDRIAAQLLEAEKETRQDLDQLIRRAAVSPQMATSLMNDAGYVRTLLQGLLDLAEALLAVTPRVRG